MQFNTFCKKSRFNIERFYIFVRRLPDKCVRARWEFISMKLKREKSQRLIVPAFMLSVFTIILAPALLSFSPAVRGQLH